MQRKYSIFGIYALLIAAWFLFEGYSSNPPNGRTNAPFDGYCTGCHNPTSAFKGNVSIDGVPDTVLAGEKYAISLKVKYTEGSPSRAGFQWVSVFSKDNTNAGELSNPGGGVGSNESSGRTYVEQRGARTFSDSTATWTFDWTAPEGDDGAEIKMYYAGNITDGNGNASGDLPVSGSSTLTLSAASAPLVATISEQSDVLCHGEASGSATVVASGGKGPYQYSWSSGSSDATESSLGFGTHQVTVTDAEGAETVAEVTIDQPDPLSVEVTTTDATCPSASDGTAVAVVSGGTADYAYTWPDGSANSMTSSLSSGAYSLMVEDQNGCTSTVMYQISFQEDTEPPTLMNCPEDASISVTDTFFYDFPTVSDNCGVDTILLLAGPPSGSFFPEGSTTVTFLARDNSGNQDSCSFIVEASVGTATIDVALDQALRLFPNPVESYLLVVSEFEDPLQMNVFNELGQNLFDQIITTGTNKISAEHLSPGIYFVQISTKGKMTYKKFIKK